MYLPRFEKGKTLAVVVRCELWMGTLAWENAKFDTPSIRRVSNGMRFSDWFENIGLKYSHLPREATISFTVVGMSPNEDKSSKNKVIETPLAYCRFPIVDHRHCLRNGQYRLNLWPIPLFKKTKHGVQSDPFGGNWEFRYRGPTRDCYIISERQRAKRAKREKRRIKKQSTIIGNNNNNTNNTNTKRKKKGTMNTVVTTSTQSTNTTNNTNKKQGNNNNNNNNKTNEKKKDRKNKKRHGNKNGKGICRLYFEFEQRTFDVVAPMISLGKSLNRNSLSKTRSKSERNLLPGMQGNDDDEKSKVEPATKILSDTEWKQVHHVITRDALETLSNEEKNLIWKARDQLVRVPDALPTFLRSVDWRDPWHRGEAYQYLRQWQPPSYLEDALELLTYEFADTRVREYGVMCIANMHDSDLQRYLLQLVQCLKFELHHNNALIRLLMRRALMNRYQIGHFLF